jgi:integrase
MSARITKRTVDALQTSDRDQFVWDSEIRGFGVKLTPANRRVFILVYRFPRGRAGRVKRYTLGVYGCITAEEARNVAKRLVGEIAAGIDPMAVLQAQRKAAEAERRAPQKSFEVIAKRFIEQHHKAQNRHWREAERLINRHVMPLWRRRNITDITRGEINEVLDSIEENNGPTTAHAVLKQIRKMFNWYAVKDERFASPIVRGMARMSPRKQRRTRTLNDDEIRVVWQALEASNPPFRQLLRFLLLTAQRRGEASGATHAEIRDDVWRIPPERYKTEKVHIVPLTGFAREQLRDLGDLANLGEYVFTTTGDKPYQGLPKAKRQLDQEIERILRSQLPPEKKDAPAPLMPNWRVHDLRRTAKTLMQRAKVRPDVSERVLGHAIPGVAGTYDQYEYFDEKRDALERLSAEIRRILGSLSTRRESEPLAA